MHDGFGATRRLAHASGDDRRHMSSEVHDVSVLPAASLMRAAMTDGPCRLSGTMCLCYHHLAWYHISITVEVKWLMPQYRQTAARTFVGGYCSIS